MAFILAFNIWLVNKTSFSIFDWLKVTDRFHELFITNNITVYGQSIWSHHLTFCLMFACSMVCTFAWSKAMTWILFLIARLSLDHDAIVNFFYLKHKNSGNTVTIIWFWLTFNKKLKVNSDVTRRYKVSKFVKLGGADRKIKVIRFFSANYYSFLEFLSSVFLRVLKRFFWMIFFNLKF